MFSSMVVGIVIIIIIKNFNNDNNNYNYINFDIVLKYNCNLCLVGWSTGGYFDTCNSSKEKIY